MPLVPLTTVVKEWGRIGLTGFGGPPAHVSMLRELAVNRRRWLTSRDFEDANAACTLLPGPASTQLAIYIAGRVAGRVGAVVGGLCFTLPAVLLVLLLSAQYLGTDVAPWVLGAGAGAGAAVVAVAVQVGLSILLPSWRATPADRRVRFAVYALAGAVTTALAGAFVVLVLVTAGAIEVAIRGAWRPPPHAPALLLPLAVATGGTVALCWTALKVGALSYGGGFVIVPLMQHDAVDVYRWMTDAQFANAVALGQVTPGPVTATIAAVGYSAAGVGGALLASAVAFIPSFAFVLIGGERFDRLRAHRAARAVLDGAGPAAAGAIVGAAVPLASAIADPWQAAVLAAAVVALFVLRSSVVTTLLACAAAGAIIVTVGAPLT